MYIAFVKLFGYELLLETTGKNTLGYFKDSLTERELYIGKLKVIISG